MKKIRFFIAVLILAVCILPTTVVIANGPPPPPKGLDVTTYRIEELGYSVGDVFVDILFKLSEDDYEYLSFNSDYGEKLNISENSEIAQYNQDGFRSYIFHSRYATVDNVIINQYGSKILSVPPDGKIKIALIDMEGNIIQISNEFSTEVPGMDFTGRVSYYARDNVAKPEIERASWTSYSLIIVVFLSLIRMTVSIGLEIIIAIPFKIKPKLLVKVLLVNLVTQIILTVIILTYLIQPYWLAVLIMEVFVYTAEYLAYKKMFKDISKKRLLLYTVCANTVSLLIGLFLNALGIFIG